MESHLSMEVDEGYHAFFFLFKFCREEFTVTTGQIILEFGDMVDMDVKLCLPLNNI